MPAVAMPHVAIDATITVVDTGRWIVGCIECDWLPEPYFNETIAKQDAYQHNVEKHDGAAVQVTLDMPLRVATDLLEGLRKRERYARRIAIGYCFFLTFLALSIYQAPMMFVLTTVVWGALVTLYGHLWGTATQHRRQGEVELAKLQAVFEQHNGTTE